MNKELNYPVKYAVLELKEAGGYLQGWEDITRGFIASKCYVVESRVKYLADGSSEVYHKVVFPYKDLKEFKLALKNNTNDIGERIIPQYDVFFKPFPVDIVSDVFDTYEEAKEVAKSENEGLYNHTASLLGLDYFVNNLAKINQEYEEQFALCDLFEQTVLEATEDMLVLSDGVKKLQREK